MLLGSSLYRYLILLHANELGSVTFDTGTGSDPGSGDWYGSGSATLVLRPRNELKLESSMATSLGVKVPTLLQLMPNNPIKGNKLRLDFKLQYGASYVKWRWLHPLKKWRFDWLICSTTACPTPGRSTSGSTRSLSPPSSPPAIFCQVTGSNYR